VLAAAFTDAAVYRRKRATYSCSNTGLSDAARDVFLGYHNEARLRVAQGIEPNNVGYLNPAKNMYKLEWDCAMEQQAQDAIATCPSSLGSWSNMGQNLIRWSSSAGFSNPAGQINSSLANWWGKAKQYGVTDPDNKYTSSSLYSFANMVFAETTKIGCAYQVCGNYLTVTCLYNAIAYYTNGVMWQTGTACTAGSCTTYANSGCAAGLCTKGADVPETNNNCAANTNMTDSVRDTFLSIHNNYRSSVARGLEPDALGGYAPKASKMLKMKYDCTVEASALQHAQKCVYQHSASADRPGLGENIYMTSALNFDKNKAATQASQMWWSELAQYGVGPSNNLTLALWNRANTQIGHYTQMAWETSYRLGCAVVHCSTFTFGVCQYGPAGNYINSLIYTMGNPCTSDAGCPGSYTCNVAEGLCNVV
ncbi:SCP-like protein, partial [Oesophagostomum dentatum]